jgi:amino acid transporter
MTFVVFTYGYTSFKPWSVQNFFIYYAMLILAPILYFTWKILKRTSIIPSHKVDLTWDAPIIDAYEATFYEPALSFWQEMIRLVGINKKGKGDNRRASVISQT